MVGDKTLHQIFAEILSDLGLPSQILSRLAEVFNRNKTWTAWSKNVPDIVRFLGSVRKAKTYEVTSLSANFVSVCILT